MCVCVHVCGGEGGHACILECVCMCGCVYHVICTNVASQNQKPTCS